MIQPSSLTGIIWTENDLNPTCEGHLDSETLKWLLLLFSKNLKWLWSAEVISGECESLACCWVRRGGGAVQPRRVPRRGGGALVRRRGPRADAPPRPPPVRRRLPPPLQWYSITIDSIRHRLPLFNHGWLAELVPAARQLRRRPATLQTTALLASSFPYLTIALHKQLLLEQSQTSNITCHGAKSDGSSMCIPTNIYS